MTDRCDISSAMAIRLTSWDLGDDKSTLVQVMAWCRQATSHYPKQCWPRSLPPYGVTGPQWVKALPLRAAMMPNLSSLTTLEVVAMTTSGATNDDIIFAWSRLLCRDIKILIRSKSAAKLWFRYRSLEEEVYYFVVVDRRPLWYSHAGLQRIDQSQLHEWPR